MLRNYRGWRGDPAAGHGALGGGEEANEFLMPVLRHAAADDVSVENIQRREQGGRSVSLVIVGHGPAFPRFQRQAGLVRSSA